MRDMSTTLSNGSSDVLPGSSPLFPTTVRHYSQATAEGEQAAATQVRFVPPAGMVSYRTISW
jgi:hypothetical protein